MSNAILLHGGTGCGKTTIARIIANELNKGMGDPIEIDAASNNGVDQVRAIIEQTTSRALLGEYKVFIIDECHMISKEGWNAFLKCLEECPQYSVLIFCTTEKNKVPATILNRVQQFSLAKIPTSKIYERLCYICKSEQYTNYEKTCDLISKTSQGGMRDAISKLEQCASYSTDLSIENAKQVLGESNFETMFKLTWALQNKDIKEIMTVIDGLAEAGHDIKQFIDIYLDFILDIEKYMVFKDISATAIPEYLNTQQNPVVDFTIKDRKVDYLRNLLRCFYKLNN